MVSRGNFTVTSGGEAGAEAIEAGLGGVEDDADGDALDHLGEVAAPGSNGISANCEPEPGARLSTWPVKVTPGSA